MAAAVMLGLHESFAQVKFGAIVTDLKGKVGGHVFKGTMAGGVLQNKGMPPKSISQNGKLTKADAGRVINAHQNLATSATTWKTLTDSQRTAWAAAAPSFPFRNKYGEEYTASGYQLFISVNQNLRNIGVAAVTDPPVPSEILPTPPFTITSPIPTDFFELGGTIPTGYTMTVYASSPMSPGRGYEPGRMKAIAVLPSGTSLPYLLDTEYRAVYGEIIEDATYWFEGKLTKADAGRQGVPYRVQATT